MIRRFRADRKPVQGDGSALAKFLCKSRAESRKAGGHLMLCSDAGYQVGAMRLTIEIIAAVVLLFYLTATGAAFAAGAMRGADGLNCSFSVPPNASPAARCAAI
jgi:hypothetical protein